MDLSIDTILSAVAGRIPAIVFALSFHEAAHAWMALKCGDDTAARMGRITLNPLSHLDPIGSIGIIFGFFGWGRPVPYVERNLRNPRWDAMKIAIAGPVSNLILALVFGLLYRLTEFLLSTGFVDDNILFFRAIVYLHFLFGYCIIVNICLCFFNMIPIFPLDGEKVLVGILPYEQARSYESLRQYGMMMLLMLILVGQSFMSAFIFLTGSPVCWIVSGYSLNELLFHIYSMEEILFRTNW